MRGSPNRGITICIDFAPKLSAKHRGQKSYGGKSPRGQKSSVVNSKFPEPFLVGAIIVKEGRQILLSGL